MVGAGGFLKSPARPRTLLAQGGHGENIFHSRDLEAGPGNMENVGYLRYTCPRERLVLPAAKRRQRAYAQR